MPAPSLPVPLRRQVANFGARLWGKYGDRVKFTAKRLLTVAGLAVVAELLALLCEYAPEDFAGPCHVAARVLRFISKLGGG